MAGLFDGKSEPIYAKDGKTVIGEKFENGTIVIDADAVPMRLSKECQERLRNIDRAMRQPFPRCTY